MYNKAAPARPPRPAPVRPITSSPALPGFSFCIALLLSSYPSSHLPALPSFPYHSPQPPPARPPFFKLPFFARPRPAPSSSYQLIAAYLHKRPGARLIASPRIKEKRFRLVIFFRLSEIEDIERNL